MARKTQLNAVSQKLRRLLYMQYRPSELAEELDIDISLIYKSYIPKGCPHSKDATGHIWIVGTEFREWFRETQIKSSQAGKEHNEQHRP